MNCGVPFCQTGEKIGGMFTGCPLHNLIPEWNDMLWLGNPRHALDRLLKTNCFPEFTGRVCPALCEAACTCGLNGESVTVHDNELYIIETAYAQGWMQPRPPQVRSGKRVAIVGSGPSGLAAAQTLNRRGHSVTVYERSDRPGGLLTYGIPNMKLDKRVVERRIRLMEAEGVRFVTETPIDTAEAADALRREIRRGGALLRREPAARPESARPRRAGRALRRGIPDRGHEAPAGRTRRPSTRRRSRWSSSAAATRATTAWAPSIRMGCAGVTQLEMMPKPPETRAESNPWPEWPRVLKTDYGQQEAIAVFGRDPRLFTTTVQEILKDEEGRVRALRIVSLNGREPVPGTEREIPCDLMLIAAGFVGCDPSVPEAFGASVDARGAVITEEYATCAPGVFAAGDMRRGQSLVVWGIREGREAARAVDRYLMGYTEL